MTSPTFTVTLQEVSFKNSTQDFFTFFVEGSEPNINLLGLSFFDDKIFKTIDQNFIVQPGDLITVWFNSTELDSAENLEIHTTQKGLTSTTEQLILQNGKTIYDFICWQKTPISKSETDQWDKIYQENFWDDNDINSCLDSNLIEKDQSITRINSEQNSSAWQINHPPQSKEINTSTPPLTTTTSSISSKDIFIEENSSPPLEPDLRISEIFAAPNSGETEWIELENLNQNAINLQGWILDDDQGGSKPKRLPELHLPANGHLAISLKPLKISLNNTTDTIRLFYPDGNLAASQEYDSPIKGQSYSLITNDQNETWSYTDHPTPGQPNPELHSVNGTITKSATFGNPYYFLLNTTPITDKPTLIMIIFSEKTVPGPIAKSTFINNVQGQFTGQLFPAPANAQNITQIMQLQNYEISPATLQTTANIAQSPSTPPTGGSPTTPSFSTILLIVIIACLGIWHFRRRPIVPPDNLI